MEKIIVNGKCWVVAGLLMCAPFSMASEFSYQNLEFGFSRFSVDDEGYKGSSNIFGVALSGELGDTFYLGASIRKTEIDGVNNTPYSLSLGGHVALGASTDVFAELGALHIQAEYQGYSYSESGSSFTLGLRQQITQTVELAAGVVHATGIGSDENSYFGQLYYTLKPGLQMGLNLEGDESTKVYGLSLRINY